MDELRLTPEEINVIRKNTVMPECPSVLEMAYFAEAVGSNVAEAQHAKDSKYYGKRIEEAKAEYLKRLKHLVSKHKEITQKLVEEAKKEERERIFEQIEGIMDGKNYVSGSCGQFTRDDLVYIKENT
jgi:hypothetical protein